MICKLQDFYEEHALQAFTRFDKDRDGFITALEFHDIMTTLKSHLLTHYVKQNLLPVRNSATVVTSNKICSQYVTLLHTLLVTQNLLPVRNSADSAAVITYQTEPAYITLLQMLRVTSNKTCYPFVTPLHL